MLTSEKITDCLEKKLDRDFRGRHKIRKSYVAVTNIRRKYIQENVLKSNKDKQFYINT